MKLSKKPVLKQENTQLRTLNDDLSGQKTLLGMELQKCRVRNDETLRQLRRFQSENAKLVQSVEDLSKQVQNLLFRSTGAGSVTTSSVDGEDLVVFNNVEALQ